jgi:antitoxin component YwqK of YwqJK toxin-antitoxin module
MKKILFLAVAFQLGVLMANAQYKSYKISVKGDTINVIDLKGLKQGKWVIHVDPLRGEPGYEEEGIFANDKREGTWRKYTLQGDFIAFENYKHGDKDGNWKFFTRFGDLEREENWRAYNPDQPYDTIPIYGTGNNEIISYKIVKAQPYSVKDGTWTYYDNGKIVKTEEYDRGHLLQAAKTESVATEEPMKKIVPKEVLDYRKKNSKKKTVKVIDGSTSY